MHCITGNDNENDFDTMLLDLLVERYAGDEAYIEGRGFGLYKNTGTAHIKFPSLILISTGQTNIQLHVTFFIPFCNNL